MEAKVTFFSGAGNPFSAITPRFAAPLRSAAPLRGSRCNRGYGGSGSHEDAL